MAQDVTGVRTSTGLISGIDIGALVDAILNVQRAPARRLEVRLQNTQTVQAGLGQLQAQLLSLSTAITALSDKNTFNSLSVQNSDPAQLGVVARKTAAPGTYQFQSVRRSTTHQVVSRGFANGDAQQVGAAGQLVISRGGQLAQPVKLDLLNGGQGVRRGTIRITDRSGATADVDLRDAVTVADVVDAINAQASGIRAEAVGDHLQLTDLTGQTAAELSVTDLGGGHAAEDLGLAQSVASATLTGSSVFQVTDQFTFSLLNGGNQLRQLKDADDLSITLADGTSLAINLDAAANIADVLNKINNHADNAGKLTAALTDGRLVLTDNTTGTETLQVANLPSSNAREFLGLDTAVAGNVLTGRVLTAGLDSVALHQLRGGQGVTQLGEISLTDRTGASTTIDLSNAETLDDVLAAINGSSLQLRAELNERGTGIVVRDTSGATASNLVIADVNGGTVAADLGIAIDDAVASVDSGNLGRRNVNEATSLLTYSPKGTAVTTGSFRITDSSGQEAVINITSAVKTIGDVIDRINLAEGISVTARLNATGDGFELVDEAGGTGTLAVTEIGGKTAADLRLLGAATVGSDGKQHVTSRQALIVDVAATDTLSIIASKLNAIGGTVRASVIDTGAALNGFRLSFRSTLSGGSGSFVVEDFGVGLGVAVQDQGRDAVLRIGADPATAFLKTSSSNVFSDAVTGLDVTVLQAGTAPASVTVSSDTAKVEAALNDFVTKYNAYIDLSTSLTKYDPATQTRSALQGTSQPLAIQTRFNSLINRVSGSADDPVRSLADVGITLTTGGKLTFDSARLNDTLRANPEAVLTYFTSLTSGFGPEFDKALNGYNDSITGSLTVQSQQLQKSTDDLVDRIARIDAQLEFRRVRLERQFLQMETALGNLQAQQQALSGLTSVLNNLQSVRTR